MATVISQYVRNIGRLLGFSKCFILPKTAANILEISRKHVFAASDRNILNKWGVREEITTNFVKKLQFLIQTLICIINLA